MDGIGREFGDTLNIEFIDVDDPNNYGEMDYYGAYTIPFTLILDEQGEVTHQFAGLTNADTLITAIETVLITSQPPVELDG